MNRAASEAAGWGVAVALHAWLLLQVLGGGRGDGADSDLLDWLEVSLAGGGDDAASSPLALPPTPPDGEAVTAAVLPLVPVSVAPPPRREATHGDAWVGEAAGQRDPRDAAPDAAASQDRPADPSRASDPAAPAHEARPEAEGSAVPDTPLFVRSTVAATGSDEPPPAPVMTESALRALDLILDPADHETFLAAARYLGLRLLVYPSGSQPQWVLEVDPGDLERVSRLDQLSSAALSRRAHDLTPDPFFRGVRNRAARAFGLSPVGARIVAAVPAGVDRMFLEAERAFVARLGPQATEVRRLRGRLVRAGAGWRLEILGSC